MIVAKSDAKYSYSYKDEQFEMHIVNHSMFFGNCEVEITNLTKNESWNKSTTYADLFKFLNDPRFNVSELEVGEENV